MADRQNKIAQIAASLFKGTPESKLNPPQFDNEKRSITGRSDYTLPIQGIDYSLPAESISGEIEGVQNDQSEKRFNLLMYQSFKNFIISYYKSTFVWKTPDYFNPALMERLLYKNKSIAIYKSGDLWDVQPYQALEQNSHNEPTKIKIIINENTEKEKNIILQKTAKNLTPFYIVNNNDINSSTESIALSYISQIIINLKQISKTTQMIKPKTGIAVENNEMAATIKELNNYYNSDDVVVPIPNIDASYSSKSGQAKANDLTPSDSLLKTFWENNNNWINLLLKMLGVAHNQQADKKERLVTDEVEAQNQPLNKILNSMLQCRNFNLPTEFSVTLENDEPEQPQPKENQDKEGDKNGDN